MPIRAEHRWLYPIDRQQLSRVIRFDRAGVRCERCRRPHQRQVKMEKRDTYDLLIALLLVVGAFGR